MRVEKKVVLRNGRWGHFCWSTWIKCTTTITVVILQWEQMRMIFERTILRIVRRDNAPDCGYLPVKHSIRFACGSKCRVIKNRQQGQPLSMFNLLKKNDLLISYVRWCFSTAT